MYQHERRVGFSIPIWSSTMISSSILDVVRLVHRLGLCLSRQCQQWRLVFRRLNRMQRRQHDQLERIFGKTIFLNTGNKFFV
jgi:hypothetical protein